MSKHVVLVDDSKTVLASCEMAFEDMIANGEIKLSTYNDPAKMLEDVQSGKISYDLVILDINMPHINGLDLARELKIDPTLKMKPIIMLTIENSNRMKVEGKKIGITGWKVKPCSDDKLIQSVRGALGI